MKIRYILPNDRPETIAAHQKLLLDANPDCELEALNINPLKKNAQHEGEFEVDLILKHKDEKLTENQINEATKNMRNLIAQLEADKVSLSQETDSLLREKSNSEKSNLTKRLTKPNGQQ